MGTGSISRTRDGRFRPRLPRRYGRRYLAVCDTEEDARAELAAELERLAESPPEATTLGGWGDLWLDRRQASGLYRAIDRERRAWRKVKESPLGRTPLEKVAPGDVRRWLHSLDVAPKTRANRLTLVRSVLRSAVEAGEIATNPAAEVHVPRTAKRPGAWTWLRTEEIAALLSVCSPLQQKVFTTAIYTGLRAGELWALRWRDVDHLDGVIRVERAIGERRTIGPPKSGKRREVPMLAPVAAVLAERGEPDALVWPGRWGKPHASGYRAELYPALEKAAIGRRVRFHDLRHTCASHLIQGTWAPRYVPRPLRLEEVQQWLGHSSRTVTERYAHLAPDGLRGLRVAYRTPGTGLSGASPAGFEPVRPLPESGPHSASSADLGQVVGQMADLAQEMLDIVASGDPLAMRAVVERAILIRNQGRAAAAPVCVGRVM